MCPARQRYHRRDLSITLMESQNYGSILSQGNRQALSPHHAGRLFRQVVMEVSDVDGKKVGGITKTSLGGKDLSRDGKINSELVNPAKNPYTIQTGSRAARPDQGVTSKSQKVFVGRRCSLCMESIRRRN